MIYAEARDKIKDGDIVFVMGSKKKIVQSLIMWATNSSYTHCGTAFWININEKPRLMIVEAQGGTRRRILNLSYYSQRDMDIIESPRPWTEYADAATDNLGTIRYSWVDAIYAGFREKLQRYIYLPPKNLSSGEICSELIAKNLKLPIINVSPGKLMAMLVERNYQLKLSIRRS